MTTLRTGQITDFGNQTQKKPGEFKDAYSIDSKDTDGAYSDETSWTPEWSRWHGIYRAIPELKAVIDKFASWTFGRGIKANKQNKAKLGKIKGFGKDSARSVLKNQWRTAMICGDSFAEIVRDAQGRMTNLKPINPGTMKVIFNEFGIIKRYEQSVGNEKIHWDVKEIYHLSYEKIADETHGIPFPEALESLIYARNEGLDDLRILYHRNIKPIKFFEVETDDTTKLNSVESSINEAYKKSENIIIPTGVIKEIKDSSTAQYSNLDSLNYIKFLVRTFVTSCGMPEVIMGWGEATTEASANIIYLAFQQTIEDMQLYNQEQCLAQLNIEINLEFPASLEDKIRENESKRGEGTSLDPKKDG